MPKVPEFLVPLVKTTTIIGGGVSLLAVAVSWLIGWHSLEEIGLSLLIAGALVAIPGAMAGDDSTLRDMTHYAVKGKRERRLQIGMEQSEKIIDYSAVLFASASVPLLLGLLCFWLHASIIDLSP